MSKFSWLKTDTNYQLEDTLYILNLIAAWIVNLNVIYSSCEIFLFPNVFISFILTRIFFNLPLLFSSTRKTFHFIQDILNWFFISFPPPLKEPEKFNKISTFPRSSIWIYKVEFRLFYAKYESTWKLKIYTWSHT